MINWLDRLLDHITMYRLLLYYLIALILVATALSAFGKLHFSSLALIFSAVYLTALCWISNHIFAYTYEGPTNPESSLITALILALIITPINSGSGLVFLTAAGVLAMASKYLLAWDKKHFFNPAAIAVVLTSLGGGQTASWWIGSGLMLPFVVAGGLLLTRKIRRFQMVGTFLVVSYIAAIVYSLAGQSQVMSTLHHVTFSSSIFFLAFVMLTEPMTSPTQIRQQRWYAALVGALFPPQVHLASIYSTPEIAVAIGNVFARIINPKVKLFPVLIKKTRLSSNIADFVFHPTADFSYKPGQYMEWTLSHAKADSRGERRYFSLASSPTEPEIHLGVKFYKGSSSYKQALWRLNDKDVVVAAQLGGDFIMPDDPDRKLAFIAGGIGVTPYRSMLKYLLDRGEKRDIAIIYAASSPSEVVYKDVLEAARDQLGVDIHYHVNRRLTPELIARQIPDYEERLFYISGPRGMVVATKKALLELGISRRHIKTDFFTGYS
jgi:ferredoxin-NADP reductase/Na+-translocating ferredoxin:NAD+ oxidoreductase RnfD subunit